MSFSANSLTFPSPRWAPMGRGQGEERLLRERRTALIFPLLRNGPLPSPHRGEGKVSGTVTPRDELATPKDKAWRCRLTRFRLTVVDRDGEAAALDRCFAFLDLGHDIGGDLAFEGAD